MHFTLYYNDFTNCTIQTQAYTYVYYIVYTILKGIHLLDEFYVRECKLCVQSTLYLFIL